ncbi:hypothetical protein [Ramlibacter sp.]|uniref:hypothetical protein n=1 Tax=Ramlibacter sp. TaxID=1917967 RepID=UPI002622B706|nr:hypothetical protein [Ramlibacter sp.]MDB5956856.1 histidine kinase [Ramlibacter sp.]
MVSPPAFQLTRYFTLTSLVAFAVLAGALYLLQVGEINYFAGVERDQTAFFAEVQSDLLRQQKETSRATVVSVYDSGQASLARLFANALWPTRFAPLVEQAQSVPLTSCHPRDPKAKNAHAQELACIARVGAKVRMLPAFQGLDAPVRDLMRGSSVFKIKVYDLRGLTVYSSAPEMIGEDKSDNGGWRAAARGHSASELVHRNQLSVFDDVVKDRDLIQSYVPVVMGDQGVVGVFEIYSDVTPLLQQLESSSARGGATIARNQTRMQQGSANNVRAVQRSSDRFLMTIYGMLVLTYLALLFLVRRGQQFIDREARAREQAALREQEWHRDKMATMGAMAANISHNVGNPLAIISGLAEEIAHATQTGGEVKPEYPAMIVEQTARVAGMTRRITHFASARRNAPEIVDINEQIKAICDFLRFDRRFHGSPIQLKLGESLPACEIIPDHLTEALMGLLQALEQACEKSDAPNRLQVETLGHAGEVVVQVRADCEGKAWDFPLADPRVDSARRRIATMNGRIEAAAGGVQIRLPAVTLGGSD